MARGLVALSFLVASASAFVPTNVPARLSRGRTVRMSVGDLIGADAETSGIFDPAGFAKNENSLYRNRQVELKHGRVAMLAALGVLVQSFYQLPDPVFQNPRPLAAFSQLIEQRPEALLQIVAAASLIEISVGKQDPEKAAGDVGFGQGFKPEDDEEYKKLQLKELKNGRLAMLGISGMLIQEALTQQGPIEQLLVGHISPFGDGQGAF